MEGKIWKGNGEAGVWIAVWRKDQGRWTPGKYREKETCGYEEVLMELRFG